MVKKSIFYVIQDPETYDYLSNLKYMEWGGYFSVLEDFDVLINVQQFSTLDLAEKARKKVVKYLEKVLPEDIPIVINIVKVTETIEMVERITHTTEIL